MCRNKTIFKIYKVRKVKHYYGMLPFVPNMYTCIYIDIDIHKIAVVVELGARNEK